MTKTSGGNPAASKNSASRRPTLFTFAAIFACAGYAFAGTTAQEKQKQTPGIRVQVNLVNIYATVIDANGRPVPDLTADTFDLKEEGVPQKIERFEAQTDRPLDLALMVDASLSTFKDLKFEGEAAARFISQIVRPGDTLSVFEFTETVTQLSEFSENVPTLQSATRKISPGSGTSMYDAIVLGSQTLRRRPPDRRRAIVLVTDAGETTSVSKFEDARRWAVSAETLLYAVVIRPVKNENGRNTAGEHALITIMDSAGGDFFILDELNQLDSIFDRINRELRTQYLLGYYPTPTPPPRALRHVQLSVKSGDTVRYRSQYFTAAAPK
jgi:Ca-activated chloride channel homolog